MGRVEGDGLRLENGPSRVSFLSSGMPSKRAKREQMLPAGASVQVGLLAGVCPCVRGSFAHMGAGVHGRVRLLWVCAACVPDKQTQLCPPGCLC